MSARKRAPALLRLTVPRLEGHSFQDTQTYKSEAEVAAEWARDPLPKLKAHVAQLQIGDEQWADLEREAAWQVEAARAEAEARGVSSPDKVTDHVFFEGEMQQVGGGAGLSLDGTTDEPKPEGQRINMVTAIRRVLDQELEANPRVLVFGEDVGPKGGVHAVTLGLQDKFGATGCSTPRSTRKGIVGRAVGMALAGLMPVPEIQFRKYAEPATEQINDCGTMRWRTAQPLRRADGAARAGRLLQMRRPVAQPDQRGAVRPQSRLEGRGAVERRGRGRPAAREPARQRPGDVLRASRDARRQPGRGGRGRATITCCRSARAKKTREGDEITIVTWGAMVPRCEAAAEGVSADVIDLRTLMPWDKRHGARQRSPHAALPDRP